jgi:hypothetical protein
MACPDAATRARMSCGSLVAIRSPGWAIATTVASTASPLRALPKRAPARWPRARSTALTSTERSSRDNEACRPEASRHTWATTAPLLRSSRPPRSAARNRATICRSSRSTATKAPASSTRALTWPAPPLSRGAGPSRRLHGRALQRSAPHARLPRRRGTRPTRLSAAEQRPPRPARLTGRGHSVERRCAPRHLDRGRTRHSTCRLSHRKHTTVGPTTVVPTAV